MLMLMLMLMLTFIGRETSENALSRETHVHQFSSLSSALGSSYTKQPLNRDNGKN